MVTGVQTCALPISWDARYGEGVATKEWANDQQRFHELITNVPGTNLADQDLDTKATSDGAAAANIGISCQNGASSGRLTCESYCVMRYSWYYNDGGGVRCARP